MTRAITRCPICDGALNVTRVACVRCSVSIEGRFDPCRFCRLGPEQLAVIEMFLKREGNLSRVAEEMGVSFPTARNRLTAALAALGLAEPTTVPAARRSESNSEDRRREVLEALARGELSAEAAANALRDV